MSRNYVRVHIGALSAGLFLRRPIPPSLDLADPVDVFTETKRELE
jgi:hypothetical protein